MPTFMYAISTNEIGTILLNYPFNCGMVHIPRKGVLRRRPQGNGNVHGKYELTTYTGAKRLYVPDGTQNQYG